MKAYILINLESGIGDSYSTILSAYETFLDLQTFGYDTTVVFETRRNVYFSKTQSYDAIFDLSIFQGKTLQNIEFNLSGNPAIAELFGVQHLPQTHKSYHIYVDTVSSELLNYQSYIYGHPEVRTSTRRPLCRTDILSQEVKDIATNFLTDRVGIVGLHYRAYDMQGDRPDLVDELRQYLDRFAETYKDKTILVSSNGNLVRDYMRSKYSNVISFEFSKKTIPYYPCYVPHLPGLTEEDFINHARETAAEMSLFQHCEKVLPFSPFLSNFLTYGILNNKHTDDYFNYIIQTI